MTNQELIDKIQLYYSEARNSEFSDKKITRGRKHSISSKVEDLFSFFMLKHINTDNLELWVDYPMSFKSLSKTTEKGNPLSVTVYPDVAIVRNGEVVDIIDIKMDLGWKRNMAPIFDCAVERTAEMRNALNGTYKQVDENGNKSKENYPIKFSKNLNWHIVTISDQNISQLKMSMNEAMIPVLYNNNPVHFYVFTRESHPNGGTPVIQHDEIKRFIENLK